MPLTPQQEAFAREFAVDLNATAAAVRAGYGAKGAAARGSELRKNPQVQVAIEEHLAKRAKAVELTAQQVVKNVQRIATKAEESDQLAVALKAHELLGKTLRMWVDRVEHEAGPSLASLLEDIWKKRAAK